MGPELSCCTVWLFTARDPLMLARSRASPLHAAGAAWRASSGYLGDWEREQKAARELWDEGLLRRQEAEATRDADWDAIRSGWTATPGKPQGASRSRVTWWWEDAVKGERRATPEAAQEWRQAHAESQTARAAPVAAPSDTGGHYAALGLLTPQSRRCDAQTLADAFRSTAKATHPDVAGGGDLRRFRRAVEAWELLRDDGWRKRYDSSR